MLIFGKSLTDCATQDSIEFDQSTFRRAEVIMTARDSIHALVALYL